MGTFVEKRQQKSLLRVKLTYLWHLKIYFAVWKSRKNYCDNVEVLHTQYLWKI